MLGAFALESCPPTHNTQAPMKTPFRAFPFAFLLLSLLTLLAGGCASGLGRGSAETLYSYADILEVHRSDAGKSIQLKLDQKLFFKLDKDPDVPGQWSLVEYDNRTLLMLNENAPTASGYWGVLLQARALGRAFVKLRFTPADEMQEPQNVEYDISIHR